MWGRGGVGLVTNAYLTEYNTELILGPVYYLLSDPCSIWEARISRSARLPSNGGSVTFSAVCIVRVTDTKEGSTTTWGGGDSIVSLPWGHL